MVCWSGELRQILRRLQLADLADPPAPVALAEVPQNRVLEAVENVWKQPWQGLAPDPRTAPDGAGTALCVYKRWMHHAPADDARSGALPRYLYDACVPHAWLWGLSR